MYVKHATVTHNCTYFISVLIDMSVKYGIDNIFKFKMKTKNG